MSNTPPNAQEMPFLEHLLELRDRLLKIVLTVLIVFLALVSFANDIYTYFAGPLLAAVPSGLIATGVVSPFFVPIKLTLVLSFFIAMPVVLYHMWSFIAPGLYKHEKELIHPLLISSSLLFYAGIAFAYFVVFPLVFKFMNAVTPDGVAMMPDIGHYLDFALKMFFAFGIAFEVPIATILLVWTGMTTPEALAKKRPYIIVGAFVVGMLMTPPDMISQTLLAIPILLLFEAGLFFSRFFLKKKAEREAQQEKEAAEQLEKDLDDEFERLTADDDK